MDDKGKDKIISPLVTLENWLRVSDKPDFRESKKAMLSLAAGIESSTLGADIKRELKPEFNALAASIKAKNTKKALEDFDNLLDVFRKKLNIKLR